MWLPALRSGLPENVEITLPSVLTQSIHAISRGGPNKMAQLLMGEDRVERSRVEPDGEMTDWKRDYSTYLKSYIQEVRRHEIASRLASSLLEFVCWIFW